MKKEEVIKKFINVINMLFPPICGICGKINQEGLCNKCKVKLQELEESSIINIEKIVVFIPPFSF